LDFCPAFWDWLIDNNWEGRVFSIDKVADELSSGADELNDWMRQEGNDLFFETNNDVAAQFPEWATSQQYESVAINTFLKAAELPHRPCPGEHPYCGNL